VSCVFIPVLDCFIVTVVFRPTNFPGGRTFLLIWNDKWRSFVAGYRSFGTTCPSNLDAWRCYLAVIPKRPLPFTIPPAPRNISEQRGPELQSRLKSRKERMLGSCFDVTRDTRLLELLEFGNSVVTSYVQLGFVAMELKCKMLYEWRQNMFTK